MSGPATTDRVVISPTDRRTTILDVIRGARREISLSLSRCNDEAIFVELAHATARGVTVDALVTARAKGSAKKLDRLCQTLAHTGATIHKYNDPVVTYHARYLVADEGPALVASLNFTRKSFARTFDALVVTYDAAVVAGLRLLMTADREGRSLEESPTPRLIVSPERARQQFTGLIAGARRSIRLIDAQLSDPGFVRLLEARRAAGVIVDVFSGKRLGALKSHGKILLIDNRLAVVGGLALATSSLDVRREVAITVEEPIAVLDLERLFDEIAVAPATRSSGIEAGG